MWCDSDHILLVLLVHNGGEQMQTIASHLKESGIIDCRGGLRTKDSRNKAKISRGVKLKSHHVKWNIEKPQKKEPKKTHEQKVYMLSMHYVKKPSMAGE